jgi:hypothetical protein
VRSWPAIVVAPLLALADQGVAYALVAWSCAEQDRLLLNAVHAVFLGGIALTLWMAWRGLRPARAGIHEGASQAPGAFFPLIGVWIAALAALSVAAMWITHIAVSPCFG